MAGVKITDLTPLLTAASDDLLYIVDVSDTTQSPQGTSKQIEVGNVARPYKVYVALMTQSGGLDPNITILENTIGNIVWTYESDGFFTATLAGAFTLNKTAIFPVMFGDDNSTPFHSYGVCTDSNYIELYVWNASGSTQPSILGDGNNLKCPIEIRVYN
jgi:hypothetical protein